jgi:hypothetical protein
MIYSEKPNHHDPQICRPMMDNTISRNAQNPHKLTRVLTARLYQSPVEAWSAFFIRWEGGANSFIEDSR